MCSLTDVFIFYDLQKLVLLSLKTVFLFSTYFFSNYLQFFVLFLSSFWFRVAWSRCFVWSAWWFFWFYFQFFEFYFKACPAMFFFVFSFFGHAETASGAKNAWFCGVNRFQFNLNYDWGNSVWTKIRLQDCDFFVPMPQFDLNFLQFLFNFLWDFFLSGFPYPCSVHFKSCLLFGQWKFFELCQDLSCYVFSWIVFDHGWFF